jgi:hypothetical protein
MQKVFRKVYKERQDFQEEGAHKQLLVQVSVLLFRFRAG